MSTEVAEVSTGGERRASTEVSMEVKREVGSESENRWTEASMKVGMEVRSKVSTDLSMGTMGHIEVEVSSTAIL